MNAALDAVLNAIDERANRTVEVDYQLYFDKNTGTYYIPDAQGRWFKGSEKVAQRHLKIKHNVSTFRERGVPHTDMEDVLWRINQRCQVGYGGKLAGYRPGVYEQHGETVLVTDGPKLIDPKEGEFPAINKFLNGLLGEEQRRYFDCWLKVAVEALISQRFRPGQAFVIAGPRDCGKSVLQNLIITQVIGGRMAKPYQFMSGATPFNSNLFEAEHLKIEDDIAFSDIRARRNFGSHLKQFTANEGVQHHAKGRPAMTLNPFWRVSVSLNDEPENLAIIPPIDDSLSDKIILCKAYRNELPMPTTTDEERTAFQGEIKQEMPGYIHSLLKMEIPPDLRHPRYGVKAYLHPELLGSLNEIAPEFRLLDLIDNCFFRFKAEDPQKFSPVKRQPAKNEPLKKTATEWEERLRDADYGLRDQVNKLLYASNTCGTYLTRLAEKVPDRVSFTKSNGTKKYEIRPPKD
jgi:hypothetical protein